MSAATRKGVKDVIRYAADHGFTLIGLTGSGHWRLVHASGEPLIIPQTPSCYRWDKNAKAKINRIHRSYSEDKS